MDRLFGKEETNASGLAWAGLVYSLVPYLGVIFLPFVFIIGVAALLSAFMDSKTEVIWDVSKCLLIGAAVLMVQIILWWLLFMVPFWSGYQTSYN